MEQYKNLLIQDIFISGYVEKLADLHIFKPMTWWLFLKLDNGKIIEFSANYGDIKVRKIPQIQCNFDIEEGDIFCIMPFSTIENYGVITDFQNKFDKKGNVIQVIIKTTDYFIVLDAISSFEGFEIDVKKR